MLWDSCGKIWLSWGFWTLIPTLGCLLLKRYKLDPKVFLFLLRLYYLSWDLINFIIKFIRFPKIIIFWNIILFNLVFRFIKCILADCFWTSRLSDPLPSFLGFRSRFLDHIWLAYFETYIRDIHNFTVLTVLLKNFRCIKFRILV